MEMLVVQSKVKEVVNKSDANMAGDFCEGLSKVIEQKVKKAIDRAKSNGRKTVRTEDL